MYISKRANDIYPKTVFFLYTRVQDTDIDYWKKLQQTIRYLEATVWLTLTLEAYVTMIIKLRIYASYGGHEDFWGNMGGTISLRKGQI